MLWKRFLFRSRIYTLGFHFLSKFEFGRHFIFRFLRKRLQKWNYSDRRSHYILDPIVRSIGRGRVLKKLLGIESSHWSRLFCTKCLFSEQIIWFSYSQLAIIPKQSLRPITLLLPRLLQEKKTSRSIGEYFCISKSLNWCIFLQFGLRLCFWSIDLDFDIVASVHG